MSADTPWNVFEIWETIHQIPASWDKTGTRAAAAFQQGDWGALREMAERVLNAPGLCDAWKTRLRYVLGEMEMDPFGATKHDTR